MITVEETEQTFDSWINQDFIGSELKEILKGCDVLLVPSREYIKSPDLTFPDGTQEFHHYLKKHIDNLNIEICREDDDYEELVLHSDLLRLPEILVEGTVVGVFANIVFAFLKHKLGSKINQTNVRSKTVIVDEKKGKSFQFSYDGPASEYQKTMNHSLRSLGYIEKVTHHEDEEASETKSTNGSQN